MALEPGRYLVGEAGRLLTTVIDRKHCSGKEFLVVDAGIHNLLRPALVGQPHPVRPAGASPGAAGEGREFRVVGPLCTSLDSFGDHVLPNPGPGQILEICASGAYGYTEAMPGFLSHAVPAEVLLLDGKPHLLRSRQGAERHLDDQGIPDIRRR
jgi:diaminopimelate decarboxylase